MENQEKPIDQVKKLIEALIFVSPEGVTQKKLAELIECSTGQVQAAAAELAEEYRERGSGLAILPVAGGWQLATAPEAAPAVDKLLTIVKRKHLSQPAMETLAIIAYRQPVTKPEIEAIRGVDSSGVLAGLLEKKLVRLAGRKKAPGKPLLYATTREFLLQFGISDIKELPALSELGRPPEQVEILPAGEPGDAAGLETPEGQPEEEAELETPESTD